jgi:hypothetical protein
MFFHDGEICEGEVRRQEQVMFVNFILACFDLFLLRENVERRLYIHVLQPTRLQFGRQVARGEDVT